MKLIIAIIQPTKLHAVREALNKVGVLRMTVCDAQGYGRQRGQTEFYRGNEYRTNLLRKVALEITVNEDFVERTLEPLPTRPAPAPRARSVTARSLCCRPPKPSTSPPAGEAQKPFSPPPLGT